jgi:hypothetical protein
MLRSQRSLLLLSLLAPLTSCASSPPRDVGTASHGYDLKIDGNEVSLAFTRDLTVPEFLQLAQEVTSARYVYQANQVAKAGPVTLVGRIHCERSEFPTFVGTMLYLRGLGTDVRGTGDEQYIEVAPITKG